MKKSGGRDRGGWSQDEADRGGERSGRKNRKGLSKMEEGVSGWGVGRVGERRDENKKRGDGGGLSEKEYNEL